jgi:hypothetical protein
LRHHALAVPIATLLAAVARSKVTEGDPRAAFARLTREHQDHGRDDQIQALRLRLPAVSLFF